MKGRTAVVEQSQQTGIVLASIQQNFWVLLCFGLSWMLAARRVLLEQGVAGGKL